MQTRARFYTCHCTGAEAYGRLRELMGERVEYLSAGAALCLGAAGEFLKKN
jgi:7,8-dihydropterin-6-yl-methyl-4-(beta-D-ribofuranosyl)aminobenzene 5'-phosphate synthase